MMADRDDYDMLIDITGQAGEIAMRYFGGNNPSWTKSSNSPVSKADIETDRFLRERLTAERPDYGWLSEETDDDHDRLARERIFVVDPIDGTRGFLEGNPNWCVSAAIVEGGRPQIAVLACPALGRILSARAGEGAYVNGTRVASAPRSRVATLTASKRLNGLLADRYGDRFDIHPFVPSLAYRIAMVATGEIDGAYAHGGSHEWDLAAADLILSETGGTLSDVEGRALVYNAPQIRMPALVAAGSGHRSELLALAREGGFLH